MNEPGVKDFQTAFWAAKRAMRDASEAAFQRHGVREGQEFILRCLWERDGQTPGEIARFWELATPTVTRAAIRMERAGLVERRPDAQDRRLVRLFLTDRGRRLRDVLHAELDRLNRRALAGITGEEQRILVHCLTQIRVNLTNPDGDAD